MQEAFGSGESHHKIRVAVVCRFIDATVLQSSLGDPALGLKLRL